MDTETQTTTIIKHILVNVTVEADLSAMMWYRRTDNLEEKAKSLTRAVKDFEAFLRDHRSQDMVILDVQRKYADICSQCKEPWEEDSDEEGKFCAGCGARLIIGESNG
uniref:Uncharacterized protein n=1 Tax=viral metagenome TaxID=1070528 RepID=A0A6M3JCH9_9ZZZZ